MRYIRMRMNIFPEKSTDQDLAFLILVLSAVAALIVAYIINKGITLLVPWVAQFFARDDKQMQTRQRVTEHGVRTISVDTFVEDPKKGRKLINNVLKTMPTGPTMIAKPLKIKEEEQLGNVWRLTAIGQTTPGREWLIEELVVKAIEKSDSKSKTPVIVHGPIVRYTDTTAEARFSTSMSKR